MENIKELFKSIILGRGRTVKIIVSSLVALIAISSIVGYFSSSVTKSDEDSVDITIGSENPADSEIAYQTVELRDISEEIEILGQVVFHEKVNISSKVNGRLERIYIQEGKRVSRGQLLAQIERLPLEINLKQQLAELEIARRSHDLSRAKYENALKSIDIKLKTIVKAQAELEDKRVSYENMDRILKNKMVLFNAGGISESDLESLKANHKTSYTQYLLAQSDLEIQRIGFRDSDITAEGYRVPKDRKRRVEILKHINTKVERAELEAAKSKVFQMEKNVESTRILLNETSIRSPINGLVASKNMEAGEMVKDDSIIATLVDISKVFIAMNVNERDIKRIQPGQHVIFTVDALGDTPFKGRIDRITPVLDVKTRTIEVKAVVDNPGNRLLPGMFARARIVVGSAAERLVIPLTSLIKKDGNKGEVYLVKKDILFKQSVELGNEYKSGIEIVKGLHQGDIIVSRGTNLVHPGIKRERKN
jgi:multidrug efflux pump subunit AcrA (membrane-fusion protein)